MTYRNLIFLILISCTFTLSAKIVSLDCKAYLMDIDTVGKTVTTRGKINGRSWEKVYGGLVISSTRYTLKLCNVTTETLTGQELQKIRYTRYTRYTILAETHPSFFRGETISVNLCCVLRPAFDAYVVYQSLYLVRAPNCYI